MDNARILENHLPGSGGAMHAGVDISNLPILGAR